MTGETNTDDLSPAPDAWSRPDIPLHTLAMLKIPREGITNALQQIEDLKLKGHPVAYVGDVVGTGSSRKSATNYACHPRRILFIKRVCTTFEGVPK